MFLRAEQSGLKLASLGRIAALVLLGVWLISTRADDPTRALGYVLVLSLFAVLGLAHYALIGTRFDRRWVKYVVHYARHRRRVCAGGDAAALPVRRRHCLR